MTVELESSGMQWIEGSICLANETRTQAILILYDSRHQPCASESLHIPLSHSCRQQNGAVTSCYLGAGSCESCCMWLQASVVASYHAELAAEWWPVNGCGLILSIGVQQIWFRRPFHPDREYG